MYFMGNTSGEKPTVLIFAGHDPSGGAGLQADIEAIGNNRCRAVSVITALTAQNTGKVGSVISQSADAFSEQTDYLLEDIHIDACKIGLVASAEIIDVIVQKIKPLVTIPVVLDPVITAGTGDPLNEADTPKLIMEKLAPLSYIMTPNCEEARRLTGAMEPDKAASILLETGCKAVLITSAETNEREIINRLYLENGEKQDFPWKKLPGTYHGSGCTLAASLAALLARNIDIKLAVEQAQEYTWHSLANAQQVGHYQLHPDRFLELTGDTH